MRTRVAVSFVSKSANSKTHEQVILVRLSSRRSSHPLPDTVLLATRTKKEIQQSLLYNTQTTMVPRLEEMSTKDQNGETVIVDIRR
jgi:hypothetical protein